MKTVTENRPIDTDADNFAEEVRYAVSHPGKELHPEPKAKHVKERDDSDRPWQVD